MKKLTCVCIGLVMAAAGGFGQTPEPSKRALPAVPPGPQPLDTVIQYAGQSLEARMKRGAKIAVLNFASSSEDFSDYAVEELIGVMVMGQWFTIVDRRSLDLIRKEMNLQLSGDVSDESAQAIGRQLGAEAIISGSLTNLGTAYRFRIKAINVETAVIEAQFAFTVQNDAQTAYLLTGKMPEPAPAPAPTPAPPAASAGLQAGLYGDSAFIGAMSLTDALTWAARNARPNGNYVIVLGQNEAVPPISLTYNNQNITITLKALGGQKEITFNTRAPAVPMFTVFQGASLIIEENVVLTGLSSNSQTLAAVAGGALTLNGGILRNSSVADSGGAVWVESGAFTMNSGAVTGNSAGSNTGDGGGGAVVVSGGRFTMNGGTISGNSANYAGGGAVSVRAGGAFTMNGGTISGNSAAGSGGVLVRGGRFTMHGGMISGNSATWGGGVGVYGSGTFTKSGSGGMIYGSNAPAGLANKAKSSGAAVYVNGDRGKRETTARESTALDTGKTGSAGGWE